MRTTQKPITGHSILESLEPLVWCQYASLKPKIKTPNDFYQRIDVKAYIKNPKSGKMMSSTTWTSLQQQTLTPQQLVRSCDLQPIYFRRVDFRQLNAAQQEYHLQLLETVAETKGKEFIKLNLRGCVIEKNRLILLLEKMRNLQKLDVSDCQKIDIMTVAKILGHRPDSTRFTYNYEVLCPQIQVFKMTIKSEKRALASILHLSNVGY